MEDSPLASIRENNRNWSDMTWPSVQNDEEKSFQQKQGACDVEEDVLDFPHCLEIRVGCDKEEEL